MVRPTRHAATLGGAEGAAVGALLGGADEGGGAGGAGGGVGRGAVDGVGGGAVDGVGDGDGEGGGEGEGDGDGDGEGDGGGGELTVYVWLAIPFGMRAPFAVQQTSTSTVCAPGTARLDGGTSAGLCPVSYWALALHTPTLVAQICDLSHRNVNVKVGTGGFGQGAYMASAVNEAVASPDVGATVSVVLAINVKALAVTTPAASQPIPSAGTTRRNTSPPFATRIRLRKL